jgi:hypothetical protein
LDANLYVGLVLRPQVFFGGLLEGVGPTPGVGEGVELCRAGFAGRFAEQDVVIRIGIERRVEINEVNAGVRKNPRVAQSLEIVAEQGTVHEAQALAVCTRAGEKIFRNDFSSGTKLAVMHLTFQPDEPHRGHELVHPLPQHGQSGLW